nr:substance-K receptor-like [Pocillopora verrucosa]
MQGGNFTHPQNVTQFDSISSYTELAPPLFTAIISVGLIGNLMLIYTALRWPEMRTPCNYLIVNNASADLCVVLIGAPMRIVEVYHGWPLGELACQILAPTQDVFVVVSVLTYTLIAWERHRAVLTPFKPKLTLRTITIASISIWIVSYLSTGLPIALHCNLHTIQGTPRCLATFTSDITRQIYESYLVIFFIILPLLLQTYAYSRVVHCLRRKGLERSFSGSTRGSVKRKSKKRKLIRVTILMMILFQVCYIPRGVLMLLYEFARELTTHPFFGRIDLFFMALYYAKHAINPIILFTVSTDFRTRFPCRLTNVGKWNFPMFKSVFLTRKSTLSTPFMEAEQKQPINVEAKL